MPWLVRDDKVLAALEVADTFGARRRGLLGRDALDGALLLRPARSVHTVRMRFAIDVALLDRDLQVLRVLTMAPNRVCRPAWRSHAVLEAAAGAFRAWDLRVDDRLEVRGNNAGPGS